MDGLELARRLTAIRPGFPVVMATGMGFSNEESDQVRDSGAKAVLRKPYALQELADICRECFRQEEDAA
jgi:DNA-binding response OmpR family regulator